MSYPRVQLLPAAVWKKEKNKGMALQKYVQDLLHYRYIQGDLEELEDVFIAA